MRGNNVRLAGQGDTLLQLSRNERIQYLGLSDPSEFALKDYRNEYEPLAKVYAEN